jgi:TadE-like protein
VRRADDGERGASAVEFALVLPVLLLMLFGIVDYGIYFTNQLAVNQGVQEAARSAVVGDFGPSAGCSITWSTTNANARKIACLVQARTQPVVGTMFVKIIVPDGWAKGKRLIVCEMVKTSGLSGFVPLPGKGIDFARTQMSIEQDSDTFLPPPTTGEQSPIAGMDWSWCTADPA